LAEERIKAVIDKVSALIPGFNLASSPPALVEGIHSIIREETGNTDPYLKIKEESNRKALAVYPQLKAAVRKAGNRLQQAVRFAIAGNIIDYGALAGLDLDREITAITGTGIKAQVNDRLLHFPAFQQSLRQAHTILYLGDNAGEIVFDKVLIETILQLYPGKRIYFAVRGEAVINDCLAADAYACGMERIAEVISNGSAAPGTLLMYCSTAFLAVWEKSDLIISKGQGNFESLYNSQQDPKNIYYLFVAKCRTVAAALGCEVRDALLLKQGQHL